jgi:hypothetical protein
MLAEFDLIMQQHVQRITNDDIHVLYLGPSIQNELISLRVNAIGSKILRKAKEVKYKCIIYFT